MRWVADLLAHALDRARRDSRSLLPREEAATHQQQPSFRPPLLLPPLPAPLHPENSVAAANDLGVSCFELAPPDNAVAHGHKSQAVAALSSWRTGWCPPVGARRQHPAPRAPTPAPAPTPKPLAVGCDPAPPSQTSPSSWQCPPRDAPPRDVRAFLREPPRVWLWCRLVF